MSSFLIIGTGAFAMLAGVFSFFNPISATITAEQLVAWFFVLLGLSELFSASKFKSNKSIFYMLLISAVMALLFGLFLLFNPLHGIVALTIIIGIIFLLSGANKIFFAFSFRQSPFFWGQIISGLISLLLAGMIFSNFPQSAAGVLGLFLAVELVFTGASLISLGLLCKPNKS